MLNRVPNEASEIEGVFRKKLNTSSHMSIALKRFKNFLRSFWRMADARDEEAVAPNTIQESDTAQFQ